MNDCNKYSTCQNYTAMKSIVFLGILLQCGYRGWHITGKITFCPWKNISNMEERERETERETVRVCDGKEYPVPSQTSFDRYLFMVWVFLKFDTSSQLIILKDAVKIEMRDLKNLFICRQTGWRLVTAHDISPALLDSCGFHGLQNISGQTVSPFPSHAADTILSVGFVFSIETWEILQRKNEYRSCIKAFHLHIHTCLCLQDQAVGLYTAVPLVPWNSSQSWTSKLYWEMSLLEVQKLLHQNPTQLHWFCQTVVKQGRKGVGEAGCFLGMCSISTSHTSRHFQAWLAYKKKLIPYLYLKKKKTKKFLVVTSILACEKT